MSDEVNQRPTDPSAGKNRDLGRTRSPFSACHANSVRPSVSRRATMRPAALPSEPVGAMLIVGRSPFR